MEELAEPGALLQRPCKKVLWGQGSSVRGGLAHLRLGDQEKGLGFIFLGDMVATWRKGFGLGILFVSTESFGLGARQVDHWAQDHRGTNTHKKLA